MAKKMHPTAQAMLNVHVAYMSAQLSGKALQPFVENEIRNLLEDASRLTLNEVVSRDIIKETARDYASDLEISGAIPELVGDIARRVYQHPIHNFTTLNDLLSDHLFEEFLEKILEMRDLRERLVHQALANPVYSEMASNMIAEGLRGYVAAGAHRARRLPGAATVGRLSQSFLGNAIPALEDGLEDGLKRYLRKAMQGLLERSEHFLLNKFDEEKIREIALDIWDNLKQKRVADFQRSMSALDVEEFFVISYEFWNELRQTALYAALIESGVDYFFDKYGDNNLAEILDELGITEDIMMREALRFIPPVIAVLKKKKLLEPILRRQLEGFYRSAAVQTLLSAPAN